MSESDQQRADKEQRHLDQLAKWASYHGMIPETGEVARAFAQAMGDNEYGIEETWDAFCWFRNGFNSAGARSAGTRIPETDELHKLLDAAEVSRRISTDAGATWVDYSVAERLEILVGGHRLAEQEINEFQEAEARCCPEDVGFEEWIGVLKKHDNVVAYEHLQSLVSLLLGTIKPIGPMRDRDDYPVELQRAIDFLHGRTPQSASERRGDVLEEVVGEIMKFRAELENGGHPIKAEAVFAVEQFVREMKDRATDATTDSRAECKFRPG